ncbi:MAG: pilus assembly protein [Bacilli bacterium]|nr:pilus assembly protein [Bacilli bacterium]
MNKKGQALVEFILILPILLIIIMSLIDVGYIFMNKYELNKELDTITTLYQNRDKKEVLAYAANENIIFEESLNNHLTVLTIKKELKINAPILSNIIGKKYVIETSKSIYGAEND